LSPETCKAIAGNKNAIVASCWTYFTTIRVNSPFLQMKRNQKDDRHLNGSSTAQNIISIMKGRRIQWARHSEFV